MKCALRGNVEFAVQGARAHWFWHLKGAWLLWKERELDCHASRMEVCSHTGLETVEGEGEATAEGQIIS